MTRSRRPLLLGLILVGCRSHADSADASVAPSWTQDEAMALAASTCAKLSAAGVAKNCKPPFRGHCVDGSSGCATSTAAFFDINGGGFPSEQCRVYVSFNTDDFHGHDTAAADTPATDYPSVVTRSERKLTSIYCGSADDSPWDKCRDTEKKSVDACARVFPREYAQYKALHEAARRVLDDVDAGAAPARPVAPKAPAATPAGGRAEGGAPPTPAAPAANPCAGACTCGDGSCGCCGRGCCSRHGGIAR